MISNISNLNQMYLHSFSLFFFFLEGEITVRKWINEENEVIKKIRYRALVKTGWKQEQKNYTS